MRRILFRGRELTDSLIQRELLRSHALVQSLPPLTPFWAKATFFFLVTLLEPWGNFVKSRDELVAACRSQIEHCIIHLHSRWVRDNWPISVNWSHMHTNRDSEQRSHLPHSLTSLSSVRQDSLRRSPHSLPDSLPASRLRLQPSSVQHLNARAILYTENSKASKCLIVDYQNSGQLAGPLKGKPT